MIKDILKISKADNIVIALRNLNKGEVIDVDGKQITLTNDVNRGHKIASLAINQGEKVVKYGFPIGYALKNISAGEHIHTHNIKTNLEGIQEYSYAPYLPEEKIVKPRNLSFHGYRREDGRVGIRNELWIVPTVGCVNGTAEKIIERFKEEVGEVSLDNLMVLKHNYGCSQLGDDHLNTRTVLGDVVKHPNAGGVLVLGLGCENNTMPEFIQSLGQFNCQRIKFLVSQEVSDEIAEGVKILKELYDQIVKDLRDEIPLSELKVGLKCGASDGFSGITSNPLLGRFTDFLVSQGGTAVLTEVPEMFGAETLLMDRAENQAVFDKIVALINDFKQYFIQYKQPVYENPSPGNKAGGITTLEDKSLGCTQKAGSAIVVDVLKYGETLKTKGLNLLSAPGNDLVASSALAAAGCQMVLFTTGRGTPFGSFVPTMKISSNTQIFQLKPHWIDFNAGSLIEDVEVEDMLEDFIDYILEVASGQWVNNEKNGFRELAIFKTGVTL